MSKPNLQQRISEGKYCTYCVSVRTLFLYIMLSLLLSLPHTNSLSLSLSFDRVLPCSTDKVTDTDSDQKLRRELKEKSKLLEEKLKLLRLKETEFRKVSLSKDKASKEVITKIFFVEFMCHICAI